MPAPRPKTADHRLLLKEIISPSKHNSFLRPFWLRPRAYRVPNSLCRCSKLICIELARLRVAITRTRNITRNIMARTPISWL